MKIHEYLLHRVQFELPRPIGNGPTKYKQFQVTILELTTHGGRTGLGFEFQPGTATPALPQLKSQFETNAWPGLKGRHPAALAMQIHPPARAGGGVLAHAVETALWDLMAKSCELPLYRLLGGTSPRVRVCGSTLDFPLDDTGFRERLNSFRQLGLQMVKVQVGRLHAADDLQRLAVVREILGKDVQIVADAGEAWTPDECIARVNHFRREGFEVHAVEDPLIREDFDGYTRICGEIAFTRISTGARLGFYGKRRLLEQRGVDLLGVSGAIGDGRAAAHLARDFDVPLAVGKTVCELGVHLAASLPECVSLEYSNLPWNELVVEPVVIRGGYALAPDRPGHGLELNREAVGRLTLAEEPALSR